MHTEKKRGEREKEGEGKEFYSFQYFPGPTGWLKILLAKTSYVGSTHSPFRHVSEAANKQNEPVGRLEVAWVLFWARK